MDHRLCLASNAGWILISLIGVFGSLTHPHMDVLFLYRYALALISSVLSVLNIQKYRSSFWGRVSVYLFAPFIVLQTTEILVLYKCESSNLVSYWGIDCSTLLIYPDGTKIVQVITDELAVFILSVANLFLLIDCHSRFYESSRPSLYEPFLSFVSSDEFVSAEDGASPSGNKFATKQISKVKFCCV